MIIVRLIGGMGNQLFQYATARQLSLITKMPLKIDTSVYENDLSKIKLGYFNIQATNASRDEVERMTRMYESSSLFARAYRKLERKFLPKHKRRYFKEKDYYVYEPDLKKISSSVLLEGFWQHHKYFDTLHPNVLEELTIKKELVTGQKIISDIEHTPSPVSIHIRRGDYVSDPNNLSWFGVMPVSYYQQAIDYINEHVYEPSYYIFSDDLDWARANLPLKRPATFVDIDGGTKDYLELYAMSKCRHNIIANSSFSWWAAFLNKNPDKIVIAPKNWLATKELNEKVQIQMPSWIKM